MVWKLQYISILFLSWISWISCQDNEEYYQSILASYEVNVCQHWITKRKLRNLQTLNTNICGYEYFSSEMNISSSWIPNIPDGTLFKTQLKEWREWYETNGVNKAYFDIPLLVWLKLMSPTAASSSSPISTIKWIYSREVTFSFVGITHTNQQKAMPTRETVPTLRETRVLENRLNRPDACKGEIYDFTIFFRSSMKKTLTQNVVNATCSEIRSILHAIIQYKFGIIGLWLKPRLHYAQFLVPYHVFGSCMDYLNR